MMMIRPILLLLLTVFPFCFAEAGIVVLNGLSHTYKVENGKVYQGKIAIENNGKQSQNVKLFLQDFSYQADGTFYYSPPHSNIKSNAGWIRMNTNLITLRQKEKTEVYYEIMIPDQVSEPGSYWSVIMVEPVEDLRPDESAQGINITSVIRYAIQIITDLHTEKARPDLKFEGIKIEKQNGKQWLNIAVANKGNLYCKPTVTIEIYDKATGRKTGTFSGQAMGILPQTSKSFPIDIGNMPPSRYSAVLVAADDDDNAFALTTELEIKNE